MNIKELKIIVFREDMVTSHPICDKLVTSDADRPLFGNHSLMVYYNL